MSTRWDLDCVVDYNFVVFLVSLLLLAVLLDLSSCTCLSHQSQNPIPWRTLTNHVPLSLSNNSRMSMTTSNQLNATALWLLGAILKILKNRNTVYLHKSALQFSSPVFSHVFSNDFLMCKMCLETNLIICFTWTSKGPDTLCEVTKDLILNPKHRLPLTLKKNKAKEHGPDVCGWLIFNQRSCQGGTSWFWIQTPRDFCTCKLDYSAR